MAYGVYCPVTAGDLITISVYLKRADNRGSGKSLGYSTYFGSGNSASSTTFGPLNTEWTRYQYTWTASTTFNFYSYWWPNTTSSAYAIDMCDFQVEINGHATQFTTGTRSATQGLLDRTGTSTIDISNASFDSDAQMAFDGTDDYITAGNPTELQFIYSDPFSLEVWIKADDLSGFNHVIGKTYGNYRLSVTSSGYSFRLDSNNLTTNAGTPVVGEWQHVVATWEPSTSTARVYVNGVLEQSVTDATVDWTYTSANFQLGNSPGENYHFNGTIPVARVFSKTVTSAEVLQSYNATKDRFIR